MSEPLIDTGVLTKDNNYCVLILDRDGLCVDANAAAAASLGKHMEDIIGADPFEDFSIEASVARKEHLETVFSTGAAARFEDCADGVWRDNVYTPVLGLGGVQNVAVFSSDISARKTAEAEFRESEDRFRALSEYSFHALCIVDESAKVTWVNNRMLDISMYTLDQVFKANSFLDFMAPESAEFVMGNFMKFLAGQEYVHHYEFILIRADGQKRTIEKHMTDFIDSQGRRNLMISMLDVTDQRKARAEKELLQQQLYQAQKMEAIGQLAGGMAHDFNNMLGVIMSAAELAGMEIAPDSTAQEEIKSIVDAVKRARELTLKLLTFARKDKLEVRGVKVANILDDLRAMLTRTVPKNIAISFETSTESVIKCDRNQIHQALLNVCNNAVDAMPDGGALTVRCSEISISDGFCNVCNQPMRGDFCLISVKDTGTGMPESILSKITEPFFTTKGIGKGTGLGLSVTQGIILAHGGHIHFHSAPGKGTTANVFLPALKGSVAPACDDVSQQLSVAGNETILIVDDEKELLDITGKLLSMNGYSTLYADSGEKALEIFSANRDNIAAIVLDIMMPGMDGAETCEKLMEMDPDVKIVFSSGYSVDGLAGRLMNNPARRFVQKPFETYSLCRAVRELIDNE